MDDEDSYLLGLCDEALGERGLRDHELPWAREGGDPEGPPARVDAWYPQLRAVVLLTQRTDEDRSRVLAGLAQPYGVQVFEIPREWFERDSAGILRRLPGEGRSIHSILGTPEAREAYRVWAEHGYVSLVDYEEYTEDESDGEDEWADDEDEDEQGDESFDSYVATADALGWRGRSVALALLEAVRLSRLAFEVRRTGPGLSQPAIEALLALLTTGHPDGPFRPLRATELGQLLRREAYELSPALAELEAAGHAESADAGADPDDPDSEAEWALTPSGRDSAVAWIARVLPLFGGWPPDVRGVDDADAPDAR